MYREMLQEHVCEVVFKKKNGDERTMICTLMPEFLPVSEEPQNVQDLIEEATFRDGVYTVWDLEADSWRSFREDSVISFDHDDE